MYQVVAKWAKLFLFYILHFKLSYSNTLSLKTVFGDTSKSMAVKLLSERIQINC